jgi:hypothetical protein
MAIPTARKNTEMRRSFKEVYNMALISVSRELA